MNERRMKMANASDLFLALLLQIQSSCTAIIDEVTSHDVIVVSGVGSSCS